MYRVEDYISSGLDSKIVDPDGGIHENRLRAQKAKEKILPPFFQVRFLQRDGHPVYSSFNLLIMVVFMPT